MAQTANTTYGTLIRPGAYNQAVVQQGASGLATNGIIALVGEADQGPRFSVETDLELTAKFGPDQFGAVQAKYGSGQLVDAYRAAAKPSLDPEIPGSPSRFIFIKTNASTQAYNTLASYTGTYATIKAKNYGKTGNLISYSVAANVAEVVPTTGSFSYIPAVGTIAYSIKANGVAVAGTSNLAANTTPTALVSALDGLTGIAATGGVNRNALTVSGTLLVTQNPGGTAGVNVIDVTRSIPWTVQPVAGDTLVIPVGSAIAGAGSANVGAYVVTTSAASTLRAVKLSDAGAVGAVPGTITAPVTVSPAVSIGAVTDLIAYSPVAVSLEAGDPVDGIGKSMEIAQLTGGTDLFERTAFVLGTTGAVAWLSKTGAAKLIVSASEYKATLSASRQLDQRSESMTAGGEIALKIGYMGATTATVTVTDLALTTTIDGSAGLNLTLRDYPTLNDLATYINAQSGYSCAVGTATLGQLPATTLDNVTAQGILSTFGEKNGRIKIDGYRFYQKVASSSSLVQINDNVQADSGLPKVTTGTAYLANGARGASTTADFTAGIDALARVTCNFVVPCVSRNAADDIADGLTDVTSSYDIDSINAYARTHVNAMSEFKRRRNRQAIVSKNTSFTEAQTAASNMASFRVAMPFQDVKQTTSNGTIGQFQSYMAAALAAGMQCAAFYKSIFGKIVNTSGVLMADGSFDDRDDTQVEDALLAGLLPMGRIESGGFEFISDQTTYGQSDETGTLNSIQGVYTMDLITLTLAQRIERRFKGKSVADVGAAAIVQAIESIMENLMTLKLVAPSSDAPLGYRNDVVSIAGPTATISLEVKRAGCLYFFPITTFISQVTQTA